MKAKNAYSGWRTQHKITGPNTQDPTHWTLHHKMERFINKETTKEAGERDVLILSYTRQ